MTTLLWPLERNHIRRGLKNHTFGMVRNGGKRAHQGWDLYAAPGTRCYAIADGTVLETRRSKTYGNILLLRFTHRGQTLYAAYCHLSMTAVHSGSVRKGEMIGLTGNTGNAESMRGEDQHLHFEIRSTPEHTPGLAGRIDPAILYGRAPLGWTYYELHDQERPLVGAGLKVRGVNVRERVE